MDKAQKLVNNMVQNKANGNMLHLTTLGGEAYTTWYKDALVGHDVLPDLDLLYTPWLVGIGISSGRFGYDSIGMMGVPMLVSVVRGDPVVAFIDTNLMGVKSVSNALEAVEALKDRCVHAGASLPLGC